MDLSHSNLVSNLVLSSDEKASINTSISTLEYRLELFFGSDIVEKFKFGSFTRDTILPRKADSNSDIDYMIVFNNSNIFIILSKVLFNSFKNSITSLNFSQPLALFISFSRSLSASSLSFISLSIFFSKSLIV